MQPGDAIFTAISGRVRPAFFDRFHGATDAVICWPEPACKVLSDERGKEEVFAAKAEIVPVASVFAKESGAWFAAGLQCAREMQSWDKRRAYAERRWIIAQEREALPDGEYTCPGCGEKDRREGGRWLGECGGLRDKERIQPIPFPMPPAA